MPSITNTIDINASADDVWAVLADLPATRQWLPGVTSARVDGDVRICRMVDGQEVRERISDSSAASRSYRFEHLRVPLPVRESGGIFTVTAGSAAGTATVTLVTTFEPLDPTTADQATEMISGAYQRSLQSLRRYLEEKHTWDAD
jgi:carbon monoxide dehydrogenase subunit G